MQNSFLDEVHSKLEKFLNEPTVDAHPVWMYVRTGKNQYGFF